jgi:hypothetical protein
MAKANLPVNFKDDILKGNMNGKRRFNMIQNSDGTVSFEDVTEYTQVGSTFGAAQINATNEAVNNAADASKIIDSLETIKANTQSGYIAGALAVKALNSNLGAKLLWTNDNPSSNFPGQTITLDLNNYDGVIIEFNVAKSVNSLLTRAYITKNDNSQYLSVGGLYNPSNAKSRGRTISVNNNGITLGNGYTDATDNGACIPIKIYGVHLSLD